VAAGTVAADQLFPPSLLEEILPVVPDDSPTAMQAVVSGQATDVQALVTPTPSGGRAGTASGNGEVGVVTVGAVVEVPSLEVAQADITPPVAATTTAPTPNIPHRRQLMRFDTEFVMRGRSIARACTAERECTEVPEGAERPTTLSFLQETSKS
jgi:hypothetical protein